MEREKSITRAKKSSITISELLVKEGFSAIVPGGGLIYDAAMVLVNHGKNYFSDRTADRIEEFHSALLMGDVNQDKFKQFINTPFQLDDYYAVLSLCVQDIEAEKVEIYSSLMRSLIENQIDRDLRRHFINSSKELTYSDLNFLKTIYINSKHDLMTVGGAKRQVENMLATEDTLHILTIAKLKTFGFISTTEATITHLAEQFVNIIFPSNELSPEAIGKKEFSGIKIVIVSYHLNDPIHINITTQVQDALWSRQIKSYIHIIDSSSVANSVISYSAALLVVGDKPVDEKYIYALSKFSEKRPVIRLNIGNSAADVKFKNISFIDELNFSPDSNLSVKDIVCEYIDKSA